MSTANKLTYLNGTKEAIKNAINEDFEVIDNNTTFREYADEISSNNAKYKDLIPKETTNATNTLDISNSSGLDKALVTQYGNTYQETTTGKNLFKPFNYTRSNNGIDFTYSEDGYINVNGTSTGNALSMFSAEATQYLITLEAGTYTISGNTNNIRLEVVNSNGTALCNTDTTNNFTINSTTQTFIRVNILSGKTINNVKVYPQLEKGSTATDYEKYTGGNPAPNPDYPQEIVNINGKSILKDVGKNLFNFETYTNTNDLTSTISGTNVKITGTATLTYQFLTNRLKNPYQAGTYTFSITQTLPRNLIFRTFDVNGNTLNSYTITAGQTSVSFTLNGNEDKYSLLFGSAVGQTYDININLQLEKGNQATTYQPYQEQSFDLDLKSKNLFNLTSITTTANTSTASLTNGEVTVNWTGGFNLDLYYIISNLDTSKTYTISFKHKGDALLLRNKSVSATDILETSVDNDYTLYTLSLTNISAFQFRFVRKTTTGTAYIKDIQIEQNSTATEYEPFYDINLCKIDTYKDRIYPLNGKWYLEKNIGKAVLNDNDYSAFTINSVGSTFVQLVTPVIDNLFSTTTPTIDNQKLLSNYISNFGGVTANSKIRINILHQNLGTNSSSTNAEAKSAFVNKMTGKTLIFYYVLATPTTEEITESNYPTLYNQLNNTKLYEGVNHLTFTNESGLDVEFDIEYYKDWKLD